MEFIMLSFLKFTTLQEGNPLSRLHGHIEAGRHFGVISAERSGLSSQENKKRMKELKEKLKTQGYGFKKTEGRWEGGKENSLVVNAKGKGPEAGDQLKKDLEQHARHYDQDSYLHSDGKNHTLHGTNETGFPGNNKEYKLGDLHYNKSAENQTEMRPGKKKSPARFSMD